MLSTEEEDSSSLPADVSSTPLRFSPSPDSKSPSTRSKFNAPRTPSEVSTRPSTRSVVWSSQRSNDLELLCTLSRLTFPSTSLSVSPENSVLLPVDKLSLKWSSISKPFFSLFPLVPSITDSSSLPLFTAGKLCPETSSNPEERLLNSLLKSELVRVSSLKYQGLTTSSTLLFSLSSH